MSARGWVLAVDRGGTFTDVVARAPDGGLHVRKLLNARPAGPGAPGGPGARGEDEDGDATIRALLEHAAARGAPPSELRLGTTLATNALLERRGERVLLVTTRGFADLLEIGTQQRPDLFALRIEKPPPLHERVLEIDERVLADGTVRRAPDPAAVRAGLAAARAAGLRSVAILLLHAWRRPAHEELVERLAREAGFEDVAASHRVSPEIGAVPRGDTTVADAFLTPLLRRYLEGVQRAARAATGELATGVAARGAAGRTGGAPAAPATRLLFMQSGGGLVEAARARGKDALLSGPAGGAVALEHVARALGLRAVIGLDMGGTSTDVCRCAPAPERRFETTIDGRRLRSPAIDIVSVAAGGGSVLRLRDGRFQVGPDSAGADPGPAGYGRGGPATLTDANLVLGRIRAEHFPHLRLDLDAARAALAAFGEPVAAAAGFVAVADETMAAAVRSVSLSRGHDARDEALCCFGGAGGLHACALAERLGIGRVVLHPLAGVFSAFGLLLAPLRHHAVRAVAVQPPAAPPDFPVDEARAALAAQGIASPALLRSVDARYAGADHVINLPWPAAWDGAQAAAPWAEAFAAAHRERFGFVQEGCDVEIVTARVEAVGPAPEPAATATPGTGAPVAAPRPRATRELRAGAPAAVPAEPPVHRREELAPGSALAGPALLVEDHATTWLAPGWTARVDGRRWLLLERDGVLPPARPRAGAPGEGAGAAALRGPARLASPRADDPVGLEVLSGRFMSIAAEMGEQLRRAAHSVNIKERLDFSCAVFDGEGGLVANAPHVPVHLGAMGETVRALLAERGAELREGDAWLSNDPYKGGSHLPDLTVVTPVFRDGARAFLVANRGHHADVGGPSPGSMPAVSRRIEEEGALLSNLLLARGARLLPEEAAARLSAAGARGLPERLADLRAQVASNAAGAARLAALCDELGTAAVQGWMALVQANGATVMEDVIRALLGGRAHRRCELADRLDDGTRLAVTIDLHAGAGGAGPRAVIDFAGSAPQHAGNRNAPRAVVVAAVLYVFRTLAARPIPLNAGCLRPLELRVPPGSLLDPRPPAAVCGGNVETSQRLVDLLLGALGVQAASQGTMNNVSFGDAHFAYYETVCGGAGAGPGYDGASAVHTHMTNTRLTDVEVLEQRFPVVVRAFSVRRGSGGRGRWRGGDGVVRELEFLRPLAVSVLAERRRTAPFGLRGGERDDGEGAGEPGEEQASPTGLRLLTPGGGAFTP